MAETPGDCSEHVLASIAWIVLAQRPETPKLPQTRIARAANLVSNMQSTASRASPGVLAFTGSPSPTLADNVMPLLHSEQSGETRHRLYPVSMRASVPSIARRLALSLWEAYATTLGEGYKAMIRYQRFIAQNGRSVKIELAMVEIIANSLPFLAQRLTAEQGTFETKECQQIAKTLDDMLATHRGHDDEAAELEYVIRFFLRSGRTSMTQILV